MFLGKTQKISHWRLKFLLFIYFSPVIFDRFGNLSLFSSSWSPELILRSGSCYDYDKLILFQNKWYREVSCDDLIDEFVYSVKELWNMQLMQYLLYIIYNAYVFLWKIWLICMRKFDTSASGFIFIFLLVVWNLTFSYLICVLFICLCIYLFRKLCLIKLKRALFARYLAELLAERQKLSPFMPVLPHSYHLLNQGGLHWWMASHFVSSYFAVYQYEMEISSSGLIGLRYMAVSLRGF